MDDLSQYQDLYVQTGKQYIQSLNASLLVLEKDPTSIAAIEEVFRSAHSLKSQSAAMEYNQTGYLCHVIEDVFYEIKNGRLQLSPELADHLFVALDALTKSLTHIEKKNQEIDLSGPADTLRQFAGVATAGAGKTRRDSSPALQPPSVGEPVEAAIPESPRDVISTVAVKVEVLDEMMNLLENLLIERLKLKQISVQETNHVTLQDYIHSSEKILNSLQYQIMKARAVPVGLVFEHFPRAVRDLARTEKKQIQLTIQGSDLELDRTIVDHLDEPLIHLLRNAVGHGIQDKGVITLSARQQKDYAEISVGDNGVGIDWQAIAEKTGLVKEMPGSRLLKEALFSGISTSKSVTQISGRGVGLTVIKQMVNNFGGTIDVISEPGKGTTFVIKLPLTLAIIKALIVSINHNQFAIPALAIERIVNIPASSVKKIADQEAFVIDDTEIPLVRLSGQPSHERQDMLIVILSETSERIGLVIDAALDTLDIVIKPIPDILKGVHGFSGVTVLSSGVAALIVNPQELL